MFSKKIPLLYLFISTISGIAIVFFYFKTIDKSKGGTVSEIQNTSLEVKGNQSNYNLIRLQGFKYISPLISFEPQAESGKYARLKTEIQNYLQAAQKEGSLSFASVYLRDFTDGNWMAINPDQRYEPGSLLKVGVLITCLRMAEAHENLLNEEMVYHGRGGFVFPVERYRSDTVIEGHKYKIKELLQSMITMSDNRATLFLENMMDTTLFKKVFTDLGMREPHFQNDDYILNVKEYSNLLKALYNGAYLDHAASEYALSLLAGSRFKNGLLKELPPQVTVAHKFGESGDAFTHQLHEAGIIYLNSNPYLLTVMTQGTDWDKLSETIGHISSMAYLYMSDTANRFNVPME